MALSEQEEFELLSLERQRASRVPNTTPAPEPKSDLVETMMLRSLRGIPAGPLGMLYKGTEPIAEESQKKYSETAYKAGGAATDIATKAGLSPPLAAGVGFGTNVGIQALPVVAGAATQKAAPAMEKAGKWFMQSAIKPGTTMRRSGEAAKAIETMLERGISPTSSGLNAAKAAVDDLEAAIQTTLENSPAYVGKVAIGQRAMKTAFDDVKHNLNRVQDEKDIDKALKNFLLHPEIRRYADQFPVALANRLKQAFYKELGERAYVPGVQPTAYDKGQKSLAATLRQEVLEMEPKARPDLAEQAKMMRVVELLKERVGASQSQNIYGLGGAMSPSITRLLIFWADRYPWFKGWLARGLYSGATPVTGGVGVGAGIVAGEEITEAIEKRNK